MARIATYTYLERLLFVAGAVTLAVALWPRTAEEAESDAATITMDEPQRVAPPPPIVAQLDVPMPYNAKLEQQCMPQPARVVSAVKRLVGRGRHATGSNATNGAA